MIYDNIILLSNKDSKTRNHLGVKMGECGTSMATKNQSIQGPKVNPIPTRLCHIIYYHRYKKHPCLVGIELNTGIVKGQ